jgi:hypothetical protein
MQMRSGRATGITRKGYDLSHANALPHVHQKLAVVRKTGHVSVSMVDFDHVAIATANSGIRDDALSDGVYRCTDRGGNVQSRMKFTTSVDRIRAVTVVGGNVTSDRHAGRSQAGGNLAVEQQVLQGLQLRLLAIKS